MIHAKEILTRIRRRLREPNSSMWKDPELLDDAWEVHCDVTGELRKVDSTGTRRFVKKYAFDTVNAIGQYHLPGDVVTVDKVLVTVSGKQYPIAPIAWSDTWTRGISSGGFGANEWSGYTWDGSMLMLWPVPDAAFTTTLWYTAVPTRLWTGTFSTVVYSGAKTYAVLKFSVPTSRAKITNDLQFCRLVALSGTKANEVAYVLSIKGNPASAVLSGFSGTPGATSWAIVPECGPEVARLLVIGGAMKSSYKKRDWEMVQALKSEYELEFRRAITQQTNFQRTHPDQMVGQRTNLDYELY